MIAGQLIEVKRSTDLTATCRNFHFMKWKF